MCLLFEHLKSVDPSLRLENLGLAASPGEDTCSFRSVSSCAGTRRRRDVAPGNRPSYPVNSESQLSAAIRFGSSHSVRLISVDLGGNDFGTLLHNAIRGNLGRAQADLEPTLERFERNYGLILRRLRSRYPHAHVVLIDQYDPLSGIPTTFLGPHGQQIQSLAAHTLARIAKIVRSDSKRAHALFVDVQPSFAGKSLELTGIVGGNVHPNAAGYKVYAGAVWRVLRKTHGL